METIKSNITELRKIINEDNFKTDEALEFLDAIEENADALLSDLESEQDEVKSLEEKVYDLRSEINSLEDSDMGSEIDCGIGTIQYEADNVQLQLLMENLEERIKEHGALATLQMLQMPQHA